MKSPPVPGGDAPEHEHVLQVVEVGEVRDRRSPRYVPIVS